MEANQDDPKSLLSNLRQHHVVHVHNPLTDQTTARGTKLSGDFTWTVARSVSQLDPTYVDPYMRQMNMRNDDHPTVKHVAQSITISSGKSMKLPGDVAQVIVSHLVDELINRTGNKKLTNDPQLRREYEEMVILNIDDLRQQLGNMSLEDQLDQQLKDLNKEDSHADTADEPAFPGLQSGNGTGTPENGVSTAPNTGKQPASTKTAPAK